MMSRLSHRLNKHAVKKEEDSNPKTLHLEKLATMLDPKLLSYYLEQVSIFLKNNKKDLWFPQISADLDAFLVRMIRDEQNLRCLLDVLDENSRRFAEDILVTLKENEDVFKLVHSYDSSKMNKNTLVYRKVFATKTTDSTVTNQFHRMCPPKSPTTPTIEDTSVAHKPPDKPPETKDPISGFKDPKTSSKDPISGFKHQWYKATLRFVTDRDMDNMEFPEMGIDEAEMIASYLSYPTSDVADMKPLYEALEVCKKSYEFRVSLLHLSSERVRLLIEKAPLNNNRSKRAHSADSKSQKNHQNQQKQQPQQNQQKQPPIHTLEPQFARTALQMILEFIDNNAEASIVFKNADEAQSVFLQRACSVGRGLKTRSMDAAVQELLTELGRTQANVPFELSVHLGQMDRETRLRAVSIIKEPKFPPRDVSTQPAPKAQGIDKENTSNIPTDNANNMKTIEKAKSNDSPKPSQAVSFALPLKPIDYNKTIDKNAKKPEQLKPCTCKDVDKKMTKNTDKAAILTKTKDATIIENTKAIDGIRKITNPTPIDYVKAIDQARTITQTHCQAKETIKPETKERYPVKHYSKLQDKKAHKTIENAEPSSSIDNGNSARSIDNREPPRVPTEMSNGKPLTKRKQRMIEDMSQPIQSDKATRMMRQMGWEGGPLGTRGEGITEPIMPAIHITPGAGLGHVKPKAKEQIRTKHFRMDILTNILQLIRSQPLRKTVFYPGLIGKKERGFLLNAVRAFTRHSIVRMNDDDLQAIVDAIGEEMVKEPRLQLSAVLDEDKRSITISKNDVQKFDIPSRPTTPPELPPPEAVVSCLARHTKTTHISGEIATRVGLEMGAQSAKAAKGLGHRIAMLGKMWELLRSGKYEVQLTFDYALTLKQVHFIKEVIAGINLRGKISYGVYENHILNEILILAEEWHLAVDFGNTHRIAGKPGAFTTATLKKKHCQRRHYYASKELVEIVQNNNNKLEMANNNKINKLDVAADSKINNKVEIASNSKVATDNKVEIANDKVVVANNKDNIKNKVDGNEKSDAKITKKGANECDSKIMDSKIVNDDIIVISSDSDLTDNEGKELSDNKAKEIVVVSDNDSSLDSVEEAKLLESSTEKVISDDDVIIKNDEEINASKRFLSDSDEADNKNRKKTKVQLPKYICIAPDSYPIEEVDADLINAFQNLILDKIDDTKDKPLIECLGLKNGAIIYGCHNENGIVLVESVAKEMDLKTTNITNLYKDKKKFKVNARINSYLDINLKKLFDKLEEYNEGLKTDSWVVTDVKRNKDNIEMVVDIDGTSFEYISQKGFGLFAGMDKMKFSVVWN